MKALKNYARQLKFLAEDIWPVGQQLPELLTKRPNVSLDDHVVERKTTNRPNIELQRMQETNEDLIRKLGKLESEQD